jgi:hypothetical protein
MTAKARGTDDNPCEPWCAIAITHQGRCARLDDIEHAAEVADQLDALTAERDAWKQANGHADQIIAGLRAELSHCNDRVTELKTALDFQRESYGGAAGDAFDAIAKLCGCEQWDYPGQLVRDVERLRAERDQANLDYMNLRKAHDNLHDRLATALQQCAKGAWIDCRERMPVDDDSYVAVLRGEFSAVDWRLWCWEETDNEWHDEWGNKCTREVFTHWTPIPETPKTLHNATNRID